MTDNKMNFLSVPDAMTAPTAWPPAEPLAIQTAYELDPFQKHAVCAIHAGDHVFVTAKTGSGKTFVGEYLIAHMLAQGKRVFYTTPIKSLSNQKYHDLKKLFPAASVGILTGDIKMQPDAQIIVMTAEILRNLFYKRGTATEGIGLTATVSLEGVGGIVMDEVHYIQDPDRGHVWEETMILSPRDLNLQMVLLSATMPSAASLAGWLGELHRRRVWLLSTTYRIVPLLHGILRRKETGGWEVGTLMDNTGNWNPNTYNDWLKDRKAAEDAAADHKKAVAGRRADGYSAPTVKRTVRHEEPGQRLKRTIEWLQHNTGMPALFFVFSRKSCEYYADKVDGSLIDSSDSAAARHIIDFHLSRHRETLEKSPQYHKIRDLLLRGVAFHHSGLLPLLKEIVEILFTRGYVKVLFATETFSVGLNMPTKTVIFTDLKKFSDGGTHRLLRPDEYIQMAGRAGRRGIDTQGLVLYEPLREPVESCELKGLLTGALPPLESRMRFHYDFILKHRLSGGKIPIAEQSYWAAQQRASRGAQGREFDTLVKQLTDMEGHQTAEYKETIDEMLALEAATRTGSQGARKKADLAYRRWKEEHMGGKWNNMFSSHKNHTELREKVSGMRRTLEAWDAAPLLQIEPQEACLREWGFIPEEGVGLTDVGVAASEVNEGHVILMPLLAASGTMSGLSGDEMACVLAAFLQESGGDDAPTIDSLTCVTPATAAALEWLQQEATRCARYEGKRWANAADFWELSGLWVSVVAQWLAGDSISQIASAFGMFEGNIQRALLRIANILEEWAAIATVRRDLATLESLTALRFLRDEIVVDSIYLRM